MVRVTAGVCRAWGAYAAPAVGAVEITTEVGVPVVICGVALTKKLESSTRTPVDGLGIDRRAIPIGCTNGCATPAVIVHDCLIRAVIEIGERLVYEWSVLCSRRSEVIREDMRSADALSLTPASLSESDASRSLNTLVVVHVTGRGAVRVINNLNRCLCTRSRTYRALGAKPHMLIAAAGGEGN